MLQHFHKIFARLLRWGVLLVVGLASAIGLAHASAPRDVLRAARKFVANSVISPDDERLLRDYAGEISAIVESLAAEPMTGASLKSGALTNAHFMHPRLEQRYREDLLHFYVPPLDVLPTKPALLIFMHGGGNDTRREYPAVYFQEGHKSSLRAVLDTGSFIAVAPSAPWDTSTHSRWNIPAADDYIAAVIEECVYRFGIDRDRVVLAGHSMGGFGAYHLCQRLNGRLAAGLVNAGSWNVARWEAIVGMPFYIIHGANDAVAPGTQSLPPRPHFTDVFYARAARNFLETARAEHIYAEHAGGHSLAAAMPHMKEFLQWAAEKRRNHFEARVIVVDPRGSWNHDDVRPSPHNRWLSILERGDGVLDYDAVVRTGPAPAWRESRENFDAQGFRLEMKSIHGAVAEASLRPANVVTVTTENARKIALWFHPAMVDFAQPITVILNGRKTVHRLKPSLWDALRSYQRQRDWGQIYHSELVLDVDNRLSLATP